MKYYFDRCFVNIADENEYLTKIDEAISCKRKTTFFYLNSYSFYLANINSDFFKALNNADFINADGYSIVWALENLKIAKIKKVGITYAFNNSLKQNFAEKKTRLYFLGGNEKTINQAVKNIGAENPGIMISGHKNGFFNEKEDSEKIIGQINRENPDVLLVGMGMPRSEIWINNYRGQINANAIISVGGFFDFMAGSKKIAPAWMYNSGLEWMYRLFQEPKRLFGRYFLANSFFVYKFIQLKFRQIFSS